MSSAWEQKSKEIERQYPSTTALSWQKVMSSDPEILGKMLNDFLKLELARPGKPGKRPAVDPAEAAIKLRQILGEDYTDLPFNQAFASLAGSRSRMSLAAKCDLDQNMVYRLMHGTAKPSAESMERVAKAFGRNPSYFKEYRVAVITSLLVQYLEENSDNTLRIYRALGL